MHVTPDPNELERDSMQQPLSRVDPEISRLIRAETARQGRTLEMIASENFVSEAILEASGSALTNKYAEGYPGRRYYGGCEFVDQIEALAQTRAKELFGAEHVNVQPHSGSQANSAVYMAALDPGDKILGMKLSHGGHLTHGHPLNFSGHFFEFMAYGVDRRRERLDYDALEALAVKERPKVIVAGASAYSRTIHFDRLADICRRSGAYLMADMAHIAGLVAADLHPSPVPHADFVTTTTHKTLRGPRSGLILCRDEHRKAIDRSVFPGLQGGPLLHIISAKAVALGEASTLSFRKYQKQVVANAKILAARIAESGFRIVAGGTDTHLFLVDCFSRGITGKEAEEMLEDAGITVNKNVVPFDVHPPLVTSGIRIGSPALTTRGMKEGEMELIGDWIGEILNNPHNEETRGRVRARVQELTGQFPLYESRVSREGTSNATPAPSNPGC